MMSTSSEPVICITTYNRIDCARINQEIIKLNYSHPLKIVHACSNEHYTGYLEDIFIKCRPKPLQEGAIDLLQRSIKEAVSKFNPGYLVHIEADNWILDGRVIDKFISQMEENHDYLLCTSYWQGDKMYFSRYGKRDILLHPSLIFPKLLNLIGIKDRVMRDFCTQFFIIRNYKPLIECILNMKADSDQFLEEKFYSAFSEKFDIERVLRMTEREPVHPGKRYICEELSLYCQHWPATGTANDPRSEDDPFYVSPDIYGKKEALLRNQSIRRGKYIQKLLNSTNHDYYNPGAVRY